MYKTLLEVVNLKKYYISKKGIINPKLKIVKAVDDVSFQIHDNETFGLVGESGCGKSTIGRSVLKLEEITDGKVIFKDEDITNFDTLRMKPLRKDMQIIFQNPYGSLNPRRTIYDSISAPLTVGSNYKKNEIMEKTRTILDEVGLSEAHFKKFPHELSGGQRQRAVIARALINDPSFVVCDEPVSALDVSVRSQVLNLMKDLQDAKKLSYLFISHDLSVVKYLCDRIAVMYLGKIVELADKDSLFNNPLHPYTKALLSAIPIPEVGAKKDKIILEGDIPSPLNPPSGCRFHTRCPRANGICMEVEPELKDKGDKHKVACHLFE